MRRPSAERRLDLSASPSMQDLLTFLGVVTPPLTLAFGVAWYMTRAELRRRRREQEPPQAVERFDRIERAVESIAMDVERLSEDQRFTTRLLAERQPQQLPLRGLADQRAPH